MIKLFFLQIFLVTLAPLNIPYSFSAGEGDKPLNIIVKNKNIKAYTRAVKGFKESPSGKSIFYRRKTYQQDDEFAIAEIKKRKPSIIFTLGTSVIKSFQRSVKEIPIVFSMVVDPVNSRISGKNIAGISLDIPVLIQLKTFKQVVPGLKIIGVLYNPAENERLIQNAAQRTKELGLVLVPIAVDHGEGEKCSNIGTRQPREVNLYLNQAVAQRLHITIPKAIIKQAQQVFGR